jgi:uncharacterized protein YjeT (DUF2065 family)
MLIVVKLVGIILAIMGIVFLISPGLMKRYVGSWQKDRRLKVVGLWRLLIGLIFILAAPRARLAGIIFALGILVLIKGIAIYVLKWEKVISMLKWWQSGPDTVMRFMSLLLLAVGALIPLILYSA